ncbi:MAG: CCA tRNA nucleotidyltransferase [Terrimicrobiaceae bacterium]
MSNEDVARGIVGRLREAGFVAYFAGGCVRDRLLGKEAHDIDIATDARPGDVMRIFRRTVSVGAHFGVVVVVEEGRTFEVATFRSDGTYSDGRRPEEVSFTTPEGDAARRDFTINGLFLDPLTGDVHDFVGGREDLETRIVRAIGEPSQRFAEDKLRILRGVRFATTLGFEIEEATWKALCAAASEISMVSVERIREELVKIFMSPGRARGLDLLDASGLLEVLLPEVSAMKGCDQPPEFHPEGDVYIHTRGMLDLLSGEPSAALAFAVLLHDVGKPRCRTVDATGRIRFNGHEHVGARMAEEILRRLRFPKAMIHDCCEMVRHHMAFKDAPQMRTSKLRRFMARETFAEEMELHRVDCLGSHGSLDIHEFLNSKAEEFASEPLLPPRLVTGADLIALGWTPGPAFRETLDAVQNLQLEGRLLDRDQALAWIQEHYPAEGHNPLD